MARAGAPAVLLPSAASGLAGAQTARSGRAVVEESRGEVLTDPACKGPEVLAFAGVKPGDRVADGVAGRFMRALSQAVGPAGKVYAIEPDEIVKSHPQVLAMMNGRAVQPGRRNVEVVSGPIDALKP